MLRQRNPRDRNPEFLAFVAACPCIACMVLTGKVNRQVQVAHIRLADADAGWRSVGMQEKPDDARSAPLCMPHHLAGGRTQGGQHGQNERAWWEELGVDVFALVRDLNLAFERGQPGAFVIARHAGLSRVSR